LCTATIAAATLNLAEASMPPQMMKKL